MTYINDDDYTPRTMPKGTKLAIIMLGIGAVLALGIIGATIANMSSVESGGVLPPETRSQAKREKLPAKTDDVTLANHPFWKKPLSPAQVRAVIERLSDGGRTLPLIIDDQGRMVDDDRAVQFSQKYWKAAAEGTIGKRWIAIPEDKLNEARWRAMLLRGLNEAAASARYDQKYR